MVSGIQGSTAARKATFVALGRRSREGGNEKAYSTRPRSSSGTLVSSPTAIVERSTRASPLSGR
jgi:hypothetical protein